MSTYFIFTKLIYVQPSFFISVFTHTSIIISKQEKLWVDLCWERWYVAYIIKLLRSQKVSRLSDEPFELELGHNQLTVRFASAAHLNLELKNLTFWGGERWNFDHCRHVVIRMETFFSRIFATVHFPAN